MEAQLIKQTNAYVSNYIKQPKKKHDKGDKINEEFVINGMYYKFNSLNRLYLFNDFVQKATELKDFKNQPLLRKEKSLLEKIQELQDQLSQTQTQIKEVEKIHIELIDKTYHNEGVKLEKKPKNIKGNQSWNTERDYSEYFNNGEVFLHRLHKTQAFKGNENYGTIKLYNDLTDLTNIWKCKYNAEENILIGVYPQSIEGEEYNTFKEFITAHNQAHNHIVNDGVEGVWKGSIKVIRQSIKEAKGADKSVSLYKLSCLSKLEKLDNYYQPRPRINMTKN